MLTCRLLNVDLLHYFYVLSRVPIGNRDFVRSGLFRTMKGAHQLELFDQLHHRPTAMSGRLASFKGPSTPISPESSPSGKKKASNRGTIVGNKGGTNPTPPTSPGRELESTFHRKVRVLLLEVRSICRLWSDVVFYDGLKAAKSLVDARTELECVSESVFSDCPQCV